VRALVADTAAVRLGDGSFLRLNSAELLKQGEELAVELVAVEVFVFDIGSAGVEDAEGVSEVPECPPDVVLLEHIEDIAEPSEGDGVGCLVVGTGFAAENRDALLGEVEPRLVELLKFRSVPSEALAVGLVEALRFEPRPDGLGPGIGALDPGRFVMADLEGDVVVAALAYAKVLELGAREDPS